MSKTALLSVPGPVGQKRCTSLMSDMSDINNAGDKEERYRVRDR